MPTCGNKFLKHVIVLFIPDHCYECGLCSVLTCVHSLHGSEVGHDHICASPTDSTVLQINNHIAVAHKMSPIYFSSLYTWPDPAVQPHVSAAAIPGVTVPINEPKEAPYTIIVSCMSNFQEIRFTANGHCTLLPKAHLLLVMQSVVYM